VFAFNQKEAMAAGCDGFLPKPVQESQLLDLLARTCGLDWELDERPLASETVAAAGEGDDQGGGLPPAEEIAALGELVSAGDVAGLRERIAAVLARGESGAAFLRQLDELAAAFRTAELRQKLAEARSVPPASAGS
jgi:CheY-like chemotaxis protein